MALEDRCSPQSAPSPPGIPHSPQSTTSSSLILDMSLHQQQTQQQQQQQQFYNQFTNPNLYENQFKFNINQQTTEISQFNQKMSLGVRNFVNTHLSSQSTNNDITIKEEEIDDEENDSIIDDHDDDHHQENQIPINHLDQTSASLSFSITNILSDNVGKKPTSILPAIPIVPDKKPIGQIFRPFEITPQSPTNDNHKERSSAFTRLSSPSSQTNVDILDYSRTHHHNLHHHHQQQQQQMSQHAAAAAAAAVMMAERANFLNCFNPAAYPRIHEEILNNTRKYQKHQKQSITHHISNDHKMPPLGSLCKTVSQIGQPTPSPQPSSSLAQTSSLMCSPPPASISSMSMSSGSSTTSSASPLCRLPNSSPQPIPPPSSSRDSGMESSDDTRSENGSTKDENGQLWPAWVYCTRYSDRPSSGPRYRRPKKPKDPKEVTVDEKRPRTAFSSDQLARLKREFNENRYLTERRRQSLSSELGLNEAQIKIWFQNKRAKIKKTSGSKHPLALQLMAQGLYNHTTVPLTEEEEELEMRMNGKL